MVSKRNDEKRKEGKGRKRMISKTRWEMEK